MSNDENHKPKIIEIHEEMLNSKCPGVTFNDYNGDPIGDPIFAPEDANNYEIDFVIKTHTITGIYWTRGHDRISELIPAPPETKLVPFYIGSETGTECPPTDDDTGNKTPSEIDKRK